MTKKPVVPRRLALDDVDEAVRYLLDMQAPEAAIAFIDALERAYVRLSRQPGVGSTRLSHELSMPGLRSWPVARGPYMIFYVEQPDHVDVWRVLHGRRDIPGLPQDPGLV